MFSKGQAGVYIHWPFCAAKCPYCDFNSHTRERIDEETWAQAYERALDHYARLLPEMEVVSVFFGGGTPSLMKPRTVERIISRIRGAWRTANDLEITLEANPTSVEAQKFRDFRTAGVNRVSLGIQALSDADLKFLGREHDVREAMQAIEIAGQTFDRYSFDLIYARPGQSPEAWANELRSALPLARGHLSLYQLTIERSTPFYMRHARGEFSIPDDVQGAELYTVTQEITDDVGIPMYEVSNHAAPGQECRHNLVYWHYADYIGVGPGAHGRYTMNGQKLATRDHSAPEIWLERVAAQGHGAHAPEAVDPQAQREEAVMVGLRLREGIETASFTDRFGQSPAEIFHAEHFRIAREEGWIAERGGRLALTLEGMLRLDSLIKYLLSD